MNGRRSMWWMWLALAIVLPLPYFAIEAGRGTVLQLLVFALATGAVAATEPSGMTAFVAALFWVQTLLYGVLIYFAVRFVRRRVRSTTLLFAIVVAVAAACAWQPVYRTPFSTTGSTATLLELY